MARCYYLDYISKGFLSSYSNDEYVCTKVLEFFENLLTFCGRFLYAQGLGS